MIEFDSGSRPAFRLMGVKDVIPNHRFIQTLRAFRRTQFGGLEAWMIGGQEVWRSAEDLEQSGVTQAGLYQR